MNDVTNETVEPFVPDAPIRKSYAYHKPSSHGLDKINELRQLYSKVQDVLEVLCPSSRERSLAITELETSAMWAIKSVVCNDPESEVAA